MAYKWLTLHKDFDRSLPITKLRYDTGKASQYSSDNDGFFSELPNINTNNQSWDNVTGSQWGYAGQNRFNLYRNYFSNRLGGFTDKRWTDTTLVSGTTYEYVLPTTLYYSGLYRYGIAAAEADLEKVQVYAESVAIEISTTAETISANGGSFTVDVESENPWTASTTDSWLTLSQTTGSTDATISVSAPYNPFVTRIGTIEFTDGVDTLTLTVTQNSANTLIPTNKIFRNGNRIN